MQDIREFLVFLKDYTKERLFGFGHRFEKLKNVIVAFLIVKRGKYSTSFLNTSFVLLVVTAFVGGPIIAENNPFVSSLEQSQNVQASTVSFDPFSNSLGTVVSAKPRDKIVNYEVLGGDTLASIADKFNVSVDTLKWANDLKNQTIKPGQTIKVPPVTGIVYKVNSGDSIYSIAKKYRTNAQKIVNFPFNDFADLDTFALTPGQTLFVPDGVVEAAPVVTAPQFASIKAGVQGNSTFIWPTSGGITQYPVSYHMALDIANNAAPPVIASDTGTVTFAGCLGYGYGCHIIVNHANGYETLYAHLSSIGVAAGQAVSQGTQIGVMGCTGRCSGTHLHFEVRSGGGQLNPLSFLK